MFFPEPDQIKSLEDFGVVGMPRGLFHPGYWICPRHYWLNEINFTFEAFQSVLMKLLVVVNCHWQLGVNVRQINLNRKTVIMVPTSK